MWSGTYMMYPTTYYCTGTILLDVGHHICDVVTTYVMYPTTYVMWCPTYVVGYIHICVCGTYTYVYVVHTHMCMWYIHICVCGTYTYAVSMIRHDVLYMPGLLSSTLVACVARATEPCGSLGHLVRSAFFFVLNTELYSFNQ